MKRRTLLGAISASMFGMAGCLGGDEYTLSNLDIEQTDDPLRIDASLSDRNVTIDGSPTLTLTLENSGTKPLQLRTTNLWPFGVPMFTRTNDQFGRIMLLSDKYKTTENVNITAGDDYQSVSVGNQSISQVLASGESVSKEYTIRGDLIGSEGTYELQRYSQDRTAVARRTQQTKGNNTSTSSTKAVKQRSRQDDWQYLFEYRPKGSKQYYAYQPTVSITVSSKGLFAGL